MTLRGSKHQLMRLPFFKGNYLWIWGFSNEYLLPQEWPAAINCIQEYIMFAQLKTIVFAASVSTLALSAAAYASEDLRISKIDVEATVATASESNALDFYPNIEEDLRGEVAQRVPLSSDGADPQIRIDVRKIALNGATMLPESKEFNELEGIVNITSPTGENAGLSFPVRISAYTGDTIAPEGFVNIPPTDADFYVAMVSTFADVVAESLTNVNTSGNKIDP